MASVDHLAHLRTDLDRLSRLGAEHLGAAVPSCPGWDVARLVDHLGRVERMVLGCLAAADPATFPGFPGRSDRTGADLLDWFADGSAALVAALADDDPERIVPSFLGPRPVAWWIRRQAHEHAIHRWDAELAIGEPADLDPAAAADGVGEFLDLRVAGGWRPPAGVAGTVHLHGTDGDGEWFVELDDGLRWETGHRKGDVAVRATLGDLHLLVWGRRGVAEVEVLGDAGLLAALLTEAG